MSSTELKVRFYIDDTYEVVQFYLDNDGFVAEEERLYKGSLSDCLAYVQLKNNKLLM